jgi:hypothetical protein
MSRHAVLSVAAHGMDSRIPGTVIAAIVPMFNEGYDMEQRSLFIGAGIAAYIAFGSLASGQSNPLDIVQFTSPPSQAAPAAPGNSPPPEQRTDRLHVHLGSLSVVSDARQRHTPWQDAAKEAEDQITDPALRQKLADRLNAMADTVAAGLIQKPNQCAVVTIAVYTDPGSEHQRHVAVLYEGVDESLNSTFFARLLADTPLSAEQQEKQHSGLLLDRAASSYMIYHLADGDLKAENVSQDQMKQSLAMALNEISQPQVVDDAASPPAAPPVRLPPAAATETLEQQQQAQAAQDRAQAQDAETDNATAGSSDGWGQEPQYQPHWITIDIPQNSAADSVAATPRNQTTPSVGATPPRVGGAAPKTGSGKARQ